MSETPAVYETARAGSGPTLCDGECNQCPLVGHSNGRMLTAVLNALSARFGDGVHEVVNGLCSNLTVCHDCRVDDFCHVEGCRFDEEPQMAQTGADRNAPELDPCPFCCNPPEMSGEGIARFVYCSTCGISGPQARTTMEAMHRWNTRLVRGLFTTILWHRPEDRMPAFGQSVAVWIKMLGLVVRAYRDARGSGGDWRVCGSRGPAMQSNLVTAWTELPSGALPPPDNGGEE